ncbi:SH3 domain-containing protein [Terrisporobacter mayombei]|uniref:SH3b domain-containing protein n=1 Tax=Terrisporobacter mayombei TaxID=1541 RepID=A0ABY9Q0I4_9FIRM|nr:SH3 domain-containing protein [Terrisporobacter mayombei]MCC3866761.1 C39 family peptidase [Terrisporobacter mayombei]WMT80998.1 hypothetical protein TEMA_13280 [Terrisporobacter mayombei]
MLKSNLQKIILIPTIISMVLISSVFHKKLTFAATLKVVNTNSLNVRSGAGTKYKVLGKLTKDTKISVISESKGWSKFTYNKKTAYVSSKYLINASTTKYVNTSSLNVRSGAGTKYKILGKLKRNTKINVISTSKGWSKFTYNGKTAYVNSEYLSNTKSVILNVPYISQYPDLPLGCEATSLAPLLQFKGVNVSKTTIAKEMKKSPNKNPSLGFVGSPFKNEPGIFQTIYPEALVSSAKKYRPNSENITGASVKTIEKELRAGNPSVIWMSLNLVTPQMGYWYENTKDQIWVNKNLHVMTVTGVDDDNFYITDPAKGKYSVSKTKFESIYNKVGKKALVVR